MSTPEKLGDILGPAIKKLEDRAEALKHEAEFDYQPFNDTEGRCLLVSVGSLTREEALGEYGLDFVQSLEEQEEAATDWHTKYFESLIEQAESIFEGER
jgi:Tat protein secretion system quality control protein TatD with DNase activity